MFCIGCATKFSQCYSNSPMPCLWSSVLPRSHTGKISTRVVSADRNRSLKIHMGSGFSHMLTGLVVQRHLLAAKASLVYPNGRKRWSNLPTSDNFPRLSRCPAAPRIALFSLRVQAMWGHLHSPLQLSPNPLQSSFPLIFSNHQKVSVA